MNCVCKHQNDISSHISNLSLLHRLWYAFRRTREWRLFVQFLVVAIFCIIKYGLLGHKMGLHATFGDGEPISAREMAEIRAVIHKNMVFSRWQKGDVLLIDNFSTSHGRQPTFDKGRKIAVCWADPIRKNDQVTSLEPVLLGDNPQERTPESTLTRHDSEMLQKVCAKELEEHVQNAFAAPNPNEDGAQALKSMFYRHHHRTVSSPPSF
jgi:hypothetical protein